MAWVIGIDEAGYGPNLGPLVQCAVALRVPEVDCDVWERLATVVARVERRAKQERLIIDDSKRVYGLARGQQLLERGVFATAPFDCECLMSYLTPTLDVDHLAELRSAFWFDDRPDRPADEWLIWRERFGTASREVGITVGPIRTMLVQPSRFNATVDASGSKATVLSDGLTTLLRTIHEAIDDDEPMTVLVDKQGGRNYYASLIMAAFPDGWVHPIVECSSESRYQVSGLRREIALRFCPRADGLHWSVALASMVCKYIREACMGQFNRWWAARIPGLKPTAGYPVDAARFLRDVQATMPTLGITESELWRKR